MRKIRGFVIAMVIMVLVSVVSLFIVSVFSYLYKWQADKALIGITVTYILAGYFGGLSLKLQNRKNGVNGQRSMGKKMLEAIFLGTIFMLFLILLSVFVLQNPFLISGRMLMIWMILVGSACLGGIL